jgi:DNA-binding transcriptional LysR family regulator
VNLQHLRYLVTVAELGTMTRAAQALHVGQPALTQAIRGLERELGVELFDRTGRRLTLTPAGQILVAGANRALDSLDAAAARIDATAAAADSMVVVAARPAAAVAPGVDLVARLRRELPDVRVRLTTSELAEQVIGLVIAGEAHLALTDLSGPVPGFVTRELTHHTFCAFLPPGTSPPGPVISWAQLASYPLIGAPRADPRWQHVDSLILSEGTTTELVVELTQRDMVLPLVEAGVGATVGYGFWRDEAERRGIVVVPFDRPETRPVGLLRLRRPLPDAAERWWAGATGCGPEPHHDR